MDYKVKQIIHKNSNHIRELAQRFNSYFSEDITAKKIIAFLLQFEDYDKIKSTLKLLSKINFLSSRKITHLIKEAYEQIEENDKKEPLISPLGTSQDSSALVCYSLFKDFFEDETDVLKFVIEVTQLENELISRNPSSLVFLDDNITSGTQLREFFDELFIGSSSPELIPIPLSDTSANKLRQIPIYVCYAIRLTKDCQKVVNEIRTKHNINLQIYSGAEDYYNYTEFSSPIIDSPEESEKMKKLVIEYSEPLYKDKDWDKEKLYNRLLGYGNLGKLTVFNHNVPKSLIPFFWKTGIVNGKVWIPLFPERQEMKKIENNSYEFDKYLYEVASILLTEGNITREPDISFNFNPLDGGEDSEGNLIFDIPDDTSLFKVFKLNQEYFQCEKNEFKLFAGYETRGGYGLAGMVNYRVEDKHSLSEEKYNEYKYYIDRVNLGLLNFEQNFYLYLTELSGQGKINININNIGIGAANNVRLRLKYNSNELIFVKPEVLVAPSKKYSFKIKEVKDFRETRHDFKEDELFEPFYYNREVSGAKLKKGMNLSYTLNSLKISHRDTMHRTLDYIITDRTKNHVIIEYELLWDESIEGIKGELKIKINKVPQSEKQLSYLYDQL